MPLDAIGRSRVLAQVMRQVEMGQLANLIKPDLKAAIDAVDDWVDAAQGTVPPLVGYHAALPLAFRTHATSQQKTLLLCWVLMRRAGLLPTAED